MPAIIPVIAGAAISSALSGVLVGGIFATTLSFGALGSFTVGTLVSKAIGALVSYGLSKALAPKAKQAQANSQSELIKTIAVAVGQQLLTKRETKDVKDSSDSVKKLAGAVQ